MIAIAKPNELTKAQRAGLSRAGVAHKEQDAFKKRLSDLSATGKEYESIRKSGGAVDVPEDLIPSTLKRFGVEIKNGKLVTTAESTPLRAGDIDELENFIAQYGSERRLSANAFLNARKALDNYAERTIGSNKSGAAKAIASELRKKYDEIGKAGIKGLKELDTKSAPLYAFVAKARKYLFDRNGDLTETGINRIANSTGKGKDKLIERLEEIYPGVTQQIQLVKALEDIEHAGGQKVGTYMKTGGVALAMGNVPALVASLIVGTPSAAVPILKVFGRMNGFADEVINRVSEKLLSGKTLNASELMLVRRAIVHHLSQLPSDKFDDDIPDTPEVTEPTNDNTEIPTNN
jgi:hypothetical protein